MRTQISLYLVASSFLSALPMSIPLAAQGRVTAPRHYRVIDLGTLGGSTSSGNAINNIGWVTGGSNDASGVQLATLWHNGSQIPLGTLGGPGSNVAWPVKNNFGLISGITENGQLDPLGESFSCPAFNLLSGNSCVAFAWRNGEMKQLPGLGGNNSVGAGNNNLNQVVGWAENNVYDPTCDNSAHQFLQFKATKWDLNARGQWQVHELPSLPEDPDSAATAVNDLGQAVGISGLCDMAIGAYSAIHALLWEGDKPTDLGNLGGHGWNTPAAINNRGVITGFANASNDIVNGQLQIRWLAFIWTREAGTMKSIGTLPGADGTPDAMSVATDINDDNQIVGYSYADYEFDNPRAFIYQNGTITALNALIGSASADWDISSTGGINDRGEIGAQANVVSNGVVTPVAHAVLLIPCDQDDPVAWGETHAIVIPDDVNKQMRQQIRIGPFTLSALRTGNAQ